MWRKHLSAGAWTAAILLLATVVAGSEDTGSSAALPPGPMQAKATTACAECHDARIILQQRLGKAAWTREVDKMVKWGAVVDAADRDALIDYFSANFPPDKSPYVAARSSNSRTRAK
jgi:hypothetical protein